MTKLLVIVAMLVACHRPPSPDQAVAEIETAANHACTCTESACTRPDLDRIEELTKYVDVGHLSARSAHAMAPSFILPS